MKIFKSVLDNSGLDYSLRYAILFRVCYLEKKDNYIKDNIYNTYKMQGGQ